MIRKGNIKVIDVDRVARVVELQTEREALHLIGADLDDAIEALCALRQQLDLLGYMEFVDKLIPHSTIIDEPITIRDVVRTLHSGTVSAEGRTSVAVDDEPVKR